MVIREEISERRLVGTDRDPVLKFKAFVRSVVLSWLIIVCMKCMEPLSFDNHAETEVVRRFLIPQRFLCPSCPGLEPEISCTATALSSHSATEAS